MVYCKSCGVFEVCKARSRFLTALLTASLAAAVLGRRSMFCMLLYKLFGLPGLLRQA